MAELPILPLNVAALLADTTHMTDRQFGAYCRILLVMWMQGGRLPFNREELRVIAGTPKREWRRSEEVILRPFMVADGIMSQKRLLDTMINVRERRGKLSAAGIKGNQRRWGKMGIQNRPYLVDKPLK